MKRIITCLALTALMLTGCHKTKEFTTHTISGEQCYLLTFDEEMGPWGTSIGLKNSLSVAWPDKGTISRDAERELILRCFGDSTSANAHEAMQRWLASSLFFEEENPKVEPTDSLIVTSEFGYSYNDLDVTYTEDSALVTYIIKCESYFAGAAHGMYSFDNLTIDKATGNVIHLTDLVTDTNLLCEAVAHAIQDLEVNKDIRDCLFDEFIDVERMPLPHNFTVDSAHNGIIVYYGLYEIASYACGIQEVVLPIFWLSKHVPLTPYAKELFGPGCSL